MVEGSNDSVSATRKSESVCLPSKSWSFASSWEIDTTVFTILSDTLSASSGLEPVETANKHKIDAESVWRFTNRLLSFGGTCFCMSLISIACIAREWDAQKHLES